MKNHSLLRYICCPKCKKNLRSSRHTLVCSGCKATYPMKQGIPVLVDLDALPEHLSRQIAYFEKEDLVRKSYVLEPWQKRYVDNFMMHGKPKLNGCIVDNATGSGYMAIELAKRGFRVIATDLTLAELYKLKANIKELGLGSLILPVCASSESLPIKSSVADGMVANAILEHLPHEKAAIKDLKRVLKSGSPLMLAMPIKLQYVWPFLWPVNIWHDRRIGHLRRYSRASILGVFTGFSELLTYYTGSLGKVLCLAFRLFTKDTRWDDIGERVDMYAAHIAYGASNVVSILQKK